MAGLQQKPDALLRQLLGLLPHIAFKGRDQFFINVSHNDYLDWFSGGASKHPVFGRIIEGMDVAEKISQVPTGPQGQFSQDVPQIPIIINKASRYNFE